VAIAANTFARISDDHASLQAKRDPHELGVSVVKIYVGNLSFDTDEAGLRAAFAEFGDVDEVAVITDRDTGRPRGFAFVTMPDDSAARAAMEGLNGKELDGRTLNVNEARAKESGARGGGGGGGGRDRRRGGW
jgi:RNA recognition motif-containing protein